MTPEGKAKSEVKKALELLELTGDVLWYERLNSGTIQNGNQFIWLCRSGTPDFISVFIDKDGNLMVCFIEVKRADKKANYSDNQKEFVCKYEWKHKNIIVLLVQSGDQVKKEILSRSYDRVRHIKLEV
jgi:hypothetical protein